MTQTAVAPTATSLPFAARGPLSSAVIERLLGGTRDNALEGLALGAVSQSRDIIRDDDIQLALFSLYASSYGSLDDLDPDLEWDPDLIAARRVIEQRFEHALRAEITLPTLPAPDSDAVARSLFELTAPGSGPSLARFIAKKATAEQVRELLMHRSIYTLREADPHSWAIPRLVGRPKAALVEIQADEYGGGRPERVHASIFAATMRGVGLDDSYGAYIDDVPALTLAAHNLMSLFGLNRRLIGAIVGHLAAFEMSSSIPSRLYADGLRRLGYGTDVTDYYDEHVEADAVHEQIAGRDLAGALAEDRPDLLEDIMFGAAACVTVDEWVGDHLMSMWEAGHTSLRTGANP